jgi:predicted transcriptional regulator
MRVDNKPPALYASGLLLTLKLEDDARQYLATEKGLEFVRRYEAIQELLKS